MEPSSLGLSIYAFETHKYPKTITLEEISAFIKSKKYKYVYNTKRTENEIWNLIEKQRIKFIELELKTKSSLRSNYSLLKKQHYGIDKHTQYNTTQSSNKIPLSNTYWTLDPHIISINSHGCKNADQIKIFNYGVIQSNYTN